MEAETSGPNPPKGVHLSYLDDPTTAVLTWHTDDSSDSRAEWGPDPGPTYPFGANGTDFTSPNGSLLHSVTLTGLTPDDTVYYRVGDRNMTNWFDGANFTVAPAHGSTRAFSFAAAGKFGNSDTAWKTMSKIGEANPDLVTPLGDLYYADTLPEVELVYEHFQDFAEKAYMLTALGNHDYAEPSYLDHCAFVAQPGNERTFAFTFGNVRFVSVDWGIYVNDTTDGVDDTGDSCGGAPGNAAIREFVDTELREADLDPNIWWKVVYHHFPCYLTDHDKERSLCVDGTGNPDQIEDIYVARGVDIVVSGHAHTFGRTYPVIFNEKKMDGSVYDTPNAPIYTNLGTGGPGRTDACRTEDYIAVCRGEVLTEGFGLFDVNDTQIVFRYLENEEGELDTFTLNKPYDYRVVLEPNQTQMLRNDTDGVGVSILGKSTDSVSLSVEGCPADTTCSLSQTSGDPPFATELTLVTTGDSPYGTFDVSIVATNGTVSRNATLTLEITDTITLTYEKGDGGAYSETDDTYLYDGSPDENFGTDLEFYVDDSGCIASGGRCSSLIKFPDFLGPNEGQVPFNTTVQDAFVEVTVTNPGGLARLHQVTEAWEEDTATWNFFSTPGQPGNKGVDHEFSPDAGRLKINVTAIVQDWVNGAANEGVWIDSDSWDGADYDSSESLDPPRLTVTFTGVPGEPNLNPPLGMHLTFPDDPTEAVLTWHTADPDTSRVEWGTSSGQPYADAAVGTDYTSPGGSHLHVASMTGLSPATTYFYRAGNETMGSHSAEASFTTPPSVGANDTFVFAAAGDWGNNPSAEDTADAIGAADVDLTWLLGDYYYSPAESDVRGLWEKFEVFGEESLVMTAIGNKEHIEPSLEDHCAFVNHHGNERTFAFTWGRTYFVNVDWGESISDETDGVDGTGAPCQGTEGNAAIRAWLDDRLAESQTDPNITWRIVIQHFPCYLTDESQSSSLCPNWSGDPDQVEDILAARDVDLVLSGHIHTYGRTHPVAFDETTQTGTDYVDPGAPIYLILGTGGLPATATCRTESYVAFCGAETETLGFGRFTVSADEISYEFVENTLGVIDAFTLTRTAATDFDVALDPDTLTIQPGESGTSTVTVSGASEDTVSLSASGCPAETTCSFVPASGDPPFTSTFTIDSTANTPPGSYSIVVTASNATTSHTATLSLQVVEQITRTYEKGDGGAYSETDDTYLYDGSPDENFGTETKFYVDASGCIAPSTECSSLIKFPDFIGPNDGQVPFNTTVQDAFVEVTVTNPGGLARLHQVTEAWEEDTATWNFFSTPGQPGNKGVDHEFSPDAGRLKINVTAIVQDWVNGAANEGVWIDSGSGNGADYDSSESSDPPRLTVTYSSPPPPPPAFDFSMSVSPSSGTTPAGGSVNATVTATLIDGPAESVSFSCADLPAGTTCDYVPTSCTPNCSTDVTIQTSDTTPPGTYPIQLVGTSANLTRDTDFSLTVEAPPPPFDFSMSVSPASGTTEPGGSLSATVTATLTSGDAETVSFSCADLPTDTTCTYTPPSCDPTCSAALSIQTSNTTPDGTYAIRLIGTSANLTRETMYDLIVETPPPFDFSMSVSPGSGTTQPGGSVNATVTATLTSGDPETVTFSCTGLPGNTTCTYTPPSCDPTCSAALTIQTSETTPPGTYPIQLVGTSTSFTRETTYDLTVEKPTVTVTFQQGDGGAYSETDDTYIVSGHPDTNYGTETEFVVDRRNCLVKKSECKGLLKFPNIIGPNDGQVPSGATIVSATLEITVTTAGAQNDAYQVTESWDEAASTWNSFATPGDPTTTGSPVGFDTPAQRITIDVTAFVQNWADGDVNEGWLIVTTRANEAIFASSESADPPKLTVTFTASSSSAPGPGPTGEEPPTWEGAVAVTFATGLAILVSRTRAWKPVARRDGRPA